MACFFTGGPMLLRLQKVTRGGAVRAGYPSEEDAIFLAVLLRHHHHDYFQWWCLNRAASEKLFYIFPARAAMLFGHNFISLKNSNIGEKVLNSNGSTDIFYKRLVLQCTTIFLSFFFHFYAFSWELAHLLCPWSNHGRYVLFVMWSSRWSNFKTILYLIDLLWISQYFDRFICSRFLCQVLFYALWSYQVKKREN